MHQWRAWDAAVDMVQSEGAQNHKTVMASTAKLPHNLISHQPPLSLFLPRPPVHRISWNVQYGKHILRFLILLLIELSKVFLNRLRRPSHRTHHLPIDTDFRR
jgi:hypothetical protein